MKGLRHLHLPGTQVYHLIFFSPRGKRAWNWDETLALFQRGVEPSMQIKYRLRWAIYFWNGVAKWPTFKPWGIVFFRRDATDVIGPIYLDIHSCFFCCWSFWHPRWVFQPCGLPVVPGEMIQFDERILHKGWFNHHLGEFLPPWNSTVKIPSVFSKVQFVLSKRQRMRKVDR